MDQYLDIPNRWAWRLGIHEHTGWTGAFTTRHVDGAIQNGTRVVAIGDDSDELDGVPVGSMGRVLGSFRVDGLPIIYFVEWDCRPRCAFVTKEGSIERLPS